jgi:hypothetical protein
LLADSTLAFSPWRVWASQTPPFGELAVLCQVYREVGSGRIGDQCLKALPATEAGAENLSHVILTSIRASTDSHSSSQPLARLLRQRSREDFRNGRILTVDGWMLSLTETRLYALAALLA